MKARLAGALVAALLLGSCCSSRPGIADFRALPLDRKLVEFRDAYRSGCLREVENVYLGMISNHGRAAADAVAALAWPAPPDFPNRAIVTLAGFIRANGTDLRGHALVEVLRRIAAEGDERDRQAAQRVLLEIDGQ